MIQKKRYRIFKNSIYHAFRKENSSLILFKENVQYTFKLNLSYTDLKCIYIV